MGIGIESQRTKNPKTRNNIEQKPQKRKKVKQRSEIKPEETLKSRRKRDFKRKYVRVKVRDPILLVYIIYKL
jgi:hypothetical protein